ncbi:hypothetical protein TNCV_1765041 [Trichonephila clavipes]|nr:hypothetical protein TNCV_1765041 [Trichonephila clavipes]
MLSTAPHSVLDISAVAKPWTEKSQKSLYFLTLSRIMKWEEKNSLAENVEIEVVSPSIVPSGDSPSLNRTVTCMVLKANDRRTSYPSHDEFRGPRSDYVRQSTLRRWGFDFFSVAGITSGKCHEVNLNGEGLILGLPDVAESSSRRTTSDVIQSGRPIFDDFFQHLWPYIGNNTANVVFQMVKRLWLIRIDQ